ncbi:PspC domain-containing protein [Kocuria marina]|uniref:PspC domain-containing protein n=1 Tax=Kocuria marina TaxID=223184 RepID=UPI0011A52040|nr:MULTISPECIES: PspC domain-containing protein [Kocuria]MCT2021237.1 PspC domain-containing protein [Kocuria marina]
MNTFFNSMRNLGFRRGPQRVVAGICGGLSHQFGINVWLVRLLVLLSFLLPVVGLALYLVVWIITPWQDGSIPLETSLRK